MSGILELASHYLIVDPVPRRCLIQRRCRRCTQVILAPFHGSYCATNDHQDVSATFEAEFNQAPPDPGIDLWVIERHIWAAFSCRDDHLSVCRRSRASPC